MVSDRNIQHSFRFNGRMRNLPWYPRTGTRDDLANLFSRWGLNEGVEVGTYKAEYACTLLKANPNLHLTCVDPWKAYGGVTQDREDLFYALALRRMDGLNVTVIRKPSLEAVDSFADDSLDFVYIDGDHSFDAAVQDIIRWSAKVRAGGLILVHDYCVNQIGADVVKAVDAYTHCHDIRPWYVTSDLALSPTAFWVKR